MGLDRWLTRCHDGPVSGPWHMLKSQAWWCTHCWGQKDRKTLKLTSQQLDQMTSSMRDPVPQKIRWKVIKIPKVNL